MKLFAQTTTPFAPVSSRCSLVFLTVTLGAAATSHAVELADLSLEELASVQVTSVSKRAQPISNAAASIYVITNSEIADAGVTSLPEALRLAPNLQVARSDASSYAISARGFNGEFSNKLLVLVDGRAVYSPIFSGVFWDAQDVVLEDIENIEVISGPGATLWGANAVNGVINIATRSAAETQGGLISVGAGVREQHATARYGGEFGSDAHYRVYLKHDQRDDTLRGDGSAMDPGWHRTQTGFRADWSNLDESTTVQGDAYTGRIGQAGTNDIEIAGVNLLGRSTRQLSKDAYVVTQAYFDHSERHQPGAFIEHLNTVDLEARHGFAVGDKHELMWGGGYRYAADRLESAGRYLFLPEDADLRWSNLFVQDEIALQQQLKLTLGYKAERNPYTGWESLPNIRLAWMPSPRQLLWTSWSRSVRSPARVDRDIYIPADPPTEDGVPQYRLAGGPNFVSEVTKVGEIGYRTQVRPHISYSLTAFYSVYDRLRTLEPKSIGSASAFSNLAEGQVVGLEAWGAWQATPKWRIRGGLVVQDVDLDLKPESRDVLESTILGNYDPDYYWMLRTYYDIADGIELSSTLRYVHEIDELEVPSYTSLDARLGWDLRPGLELSLIGQNLLDESHTEFSESEYPRSLFIKLVWTL